MTELLYLNDSTTHQFTATVLKCTKDLRGYWTRLDKTYFYPEGGGQPSDIGFIGSIPVIDVQLQDGIPQHLLAEKLPDGITVACEINADRRMDLMQQHTGQHILSHGLEQLFDAATIGFHLTLTNLTVDADKKLSYSDIQQLEDYSNSLIRSNLPVLVHYPDAQTLRAMPLRKQPKVTENIRIIEIQERDFSPCGGTHLNSTGLVQLIKVKKLENYKGGTRIEFACGNRALHDYSEKTALLLELCATLSVQQDGLVDSIEKLKTDVTDIKKSLYTANEELLHVQLATALAHKTSHTFGDLVLFETIDMDPQLFRKASAQLTSQIQGVAVLMNTSENNFQMILAQSDDKPYNLQVLFASLREKTALKGGGSPLAIQGGGNIDQLKETKSFLLEQLR